MIRTRQSGICGVMAVVLLCHVPLGAAPREAARSESEKAAAVSAEAARRDAERIAAVRAAAERTAAAQAQAAEQALRLANRELLVDHLRVRGFTEEQARVTVAALTDEDVRVLAENPRMLVPAGSSNAMYLAIFAAIMIGGAAAIVIAN